MRVPSTSTGCNTDYSPTLHLLSHITDEMSPKNPKIPAIFNGLQSTRHTTNSSHDQLVTKSTLKRAHVVFVNIPNTDFLVSFITYIGSRPGGGTVHAEQVQISASPAVWRLTKNL